jgi:5-methylcytosine-specific restriction protein B
MNSTPDGTVARAYWFVGAAYGGTNDQTSRFLDEGIWENGYKDKLLDVVRSIQPGDRIAIKSSYTRKHNLLFDNRGQTVSVMAIKAIGTVTENPGDGRIVRVNWTRFDTPHEWYFFTHRGTIWRVLSGSWLTDALIGFTFDDKRQDFDRFRNAPYWRERFGDTDSDKRRFRWAPFYEAVADKLLAFKNNRAALIEGIRAISEQVGELSYLQDKFADGTTGPLKDICPFTTIGIFNRGISVPNRKTIAAELAKFLGVEEPVPASFEGIPTLNNQKSCFFSSGNKRHPNDINTLWDIFSEAIRFADSEDHEERSSFTKAYDNATQISCVGWNLTMGLYWIRPWNYPTLDGQSQHYIDKKLGIKIGLNGPKCAIRFFWTVNPVLSGH